ncbi:hypothetical protein A8B78_15460 [Jannaschia sp. EhC01]|nr:hypothetical protein A8B78_15460 [Jannaschia sp. EhC01]
MGDTMNHFSLLAAVTAVCLAGSASASTLIFGGPLDERPYGGFGEAVNPNAPIIFDFVGAQGDNGLDAPDGNADLTISSTSLEIGSGIQIFDTGFPTAQFGGFAYDSETGDAIRFGAGDIVDSSPDYVFRSGPLVVSDFLAFGENAVFGFILDFAALIPPIDADLSDFGGDADLYCEEVFLACENTVVESYFGWVQVTRGSVIPGYIGFSSGGGQFATVSLPSSAAVVPLPAAGWLLLAGLGGLVSLRRRAKA